MILDCGFRIAGLDCCRLLSARIPELKAATNE